MELVVAQELCRVLVELTSVISFLSTVLVAVASFPRPRLQALVCLSRWVRIFSSSRVARRKMYLACFGIW